LLTVRVIIAVYRVKLNGLVTVAKENASANGITLRRVTTSTGHVFVLLDIKEVAGTLNAYDNACFLYMLDSKYPLPLEYVFNNDKNDKFLRKVIVCFLQNASVRYCFESLPPPSPILNTPSGKNRRKSSL